MACEYSTAEFITILLTEAARYEQASQECTDPLKAMEYWGRSEEILRAAEETINSEAEKIEWEP